jgi:hypothetical protein
MERSLTGLDDKERAAIESMNLPPGYTCAECGHFNFCKAFFSCDPTNNHCDWAPSRFVLKTKEKRLDEKIRAGEKR